MTKTHIKNERKTNAKITWASGVFEGEELMIDPKNVPLEEELHTSAGRPLNEAIVAMIGADQTSPVDDVLDKVRSLCNEFPLRTLRIAIDVHRSSCHQLNCPVLAVMVTTAEARDTDKELTP